MNGFHDTNDFRDNAAPFDAGSDQPPGPPRLGAAAEHRAAAEQAAHRRGFDAALRERLRAGLSTSTSRSNGTSACAKACRSVSRACASRSAKLAAPFT
ncbi:hypothetical protein [Nocardia brasiliensis]|uniref:hypothetical protein n=1 Tax=Nocardia brasiliensis TaxID=37326 RepID=UPI002457031B|nr:hypothetical protein [Nocardia brasiliensis]